MAASYPNSLLNWTSRLNSQTIFAADPNALAAEIDAIESSVGLMPMNEPSPLTNSVSAFSSMSQRLSAAYLQSGHPYVSLTAGAFNVAKSDFAYNPGFPTKPSGAPGTVYPAYYGTGGLVTIKDTGLWLVNVFQSWQYASSGWVYMGLYVGGSQARKSMFNYSAFPGSGSDSATRFLGEQGWTEATYLGRINAGTVVRVASGNYTNLNPIKVESTSLSAYFLRT